LKFSIYYNYNAIRGKTLIDSLLDYPTPDEWKFSKDLLDMDFLFIEMSKPWKIFFNGAAWQNRVCAEVIFATL
jgi:hypothetical protein